MAEFNFSMSNVCAWNTDYRIGKELDKIDDNPNDGRVSASIWNKYAPSWGANKVKEGTTLSYQEVQEKLEQVNIQYLSKQTNAIGSFDCKGNQRMQQEIKKAKEMIGL